MARFDMRCLRGASPVSAVCSCEKNSCEILDVWAASFDRNGFVSHQGLNPASHQGLQLVSDQALQPVETNRCYTSSVVQGSRFCQQNSKSRHSGLFITPTPISRAVFQVKDFGSEFNGFSNKCLQCVILNLVSSRLLRQNLTKYLRIACGNDSPSGWGEASVGRNLVHVARLLEQTNLYVRVFQSPSLSSWHAGEDATEFSLGRRGGLCIGCLLALEDVRHAYGLLAPGTCVRLPIFGVAHSPKTALQRFIVGGGNPADHKYLSGRPHGQAPEKPETQTPFCVTAGRTSATQPSASTETVNASVSTYSGVGFLAQSLWMQPLSQSVREIRLNPFCRGKYPLGLEPHDIEALMALRHKFRHEDEYLERLLCLTLFGARLQLRIWM